MIFRDGAHYVHNYPHPQTRNDAALVPACDACSVSSGCSRQQTVNHVDCNYPDENGLVCELMWGKVHDSLVRAGAWCLARVDTLG